MSAWAGPSSTVHAPSRRLYQKYTYLSLGSHGTFTSARMYVRTKSGRSPYTEISARLCRIKKAGYITFSFADETICTECCRHERYARPDDCSLLNDAFFVLKAVCQYCARLGKTTEVLNASREVGVKRCSEQNVFCTTPPRQHTTHAANGRPSDWYTTRKNPMKRKI